MGVQTASETILGLDIGAASIGWALIRQQNGNPNRLIDLGVRVFEAGTEGEIESGKDESRAKARRDARLQRRQTYRRAQRMRRLAVLLQANGLLPDGDLACDTVRDDVLKALDRDLYRRHADNNSSGEDGRKPLDQLPYFLRARALDHPLSAFELGRALYHLAQRRGFLSNRKATKKDKEEEGEVKAGIAALENHIATAGKRTLGEYFAGLDPHEQRIRHRWTSRAMYQAEFNAIWAAQAPHHPDILNDELKKRLLRAIFYQRPLRSQKGLIGKCELESGRRRAPIALLQAQRFRLLQKVNDMEIVAQDFARRKPTPDERATILDVLEHNDEVTFAALRKALKLPKGHTFNLEQGGEKKLFGNRTAARLRAIFGDRWDAFTDDERDRIVEDVRSIQKEQTLEKRGRNAWGLDEQAAKSFGALNLEDGYLSLSRQAITKLLPLMEQGIPFATAKKQVYGDQRDSWLVEALPRIGEAPIEVRNPAVERALTELRKVVNAVIGKHGKPDIIRIELARDLKRSRKDRTAIWQKNRANEASREAAARRILSETGNTNPSREDILRVVLAEECNWRCPYTDKQISMGALLGSASQFDIEHIIPYNRCLDDSFMNKTLCYNEENRNRKRNKTPYEAYGSDPECWEAILERVKRFKRAKDDPGGKLRRFLMTSVEDFRTISNRQLNDTRYVSTLAADYLALLYGGRIDANGRRRIQASRGQVTADLRRAWNLNKILGDGGEKSRDDHRHHAVDAVAIALTDDATVKALSTANERAGAEGRRAWWKGVPVPWNDFLKDVQAAIERTVVSRRVSRKVNGPLHEETYYSRTHPDEDGNDCVHVRKRIDALSVHEVDAIVDAAVRERVKAALADRDPKRAFQDPKTHPYLESRDGRKIPIHKVRIRKNLTTFPIAEGPRQRYVVPAANHHMEILEVKDRKGEPRWEDVVVDQYTALNRLKAGQPVVQRDHGPDKRFMMSLSVGEVIEIDVEDGKRGLFVIRSLSKGHVEFVSLTDARRKADIKKTGDWWSNPANTLRQWNCRKVFVTPLGEVRPAND